MLALIVAASCDVSEITKGNGWYKGPDGYVYDTPAPIAVKAADPEPIVEEVVEDIEPLVAEVEVSVPEIQNDYLPPTEYLPPATESTNDAVKRRLRKLRFRRRH